MTWQVILLCAFAYFLGSIPSAYLAGRWIRGIDIRRFGSGSVGGSNVWNSVAKWALFPVGIFDLGKGLLPTWLALGPLDMGLAPAIAAGLSATVGHAWSIYLGFTGGRALSCMLGMLVVVFPWGALFQLVLMGIGFALKFELLTTLSLLALPFFSLALGQHGAVTWGCVAIILLTMIKRLEANRTSLPRGPERWEIIWRRIWYDRDIRDHERWIKRRPQESLQDDS